MHEILRPVLIVIGLGAQEWLPELLWGDHPPTGARIGCLVFVAAIIIVLGVMIERPWSNRWLRRALFHQAKLEGVWLQRVGQPERPYSIGIIKFDDEKRDWAYEGVGYNDKFLPAAEWMTSALSYDHGHRNWHFNGESHYLNKTSAGFTSSNPFRVQPTLLVPEHSSDRITGFVVDITDTSEDQGKASAFWIGLQRADDLFPNQHLTLDQLKRFESTYLREVFKKRELVVVESLR